MGEILLDGVVDCGVDALIVTVIAASGEEKWEGGANRERHGEQDTRKPIVAHGLAYSKHHARRDLTHLSAA